jgi:carbon-monoxide dehydrogenase medium subunit
VKPANFDWVAVGTLQEAYERLAAPDREARVIAGGQSLIPMMNFRLARPDLLVDLNGIQDLAGIRETADELQIGAMTRQRALERHVEGSPDWRLVAQALGNLAHIPIRNRGTVGGSLAHADPAAELCATSLTLGARLVAGSVAGTRIIESDDFFTGHYSTALEPDEVLLEVRLPRPAPGTGAAFEEVARRKGDFALVAVAGLLRVDDRDRVSFARLGYSSMGPQPLRARAAETLLIGQSADEAAFAAAAAVAVGELGEPPSDMHATSAYRKHLAGALTRRVLTKALQDARRQRDRQN